MDHYEGAERHEAFVRREAKRQGLKLVKSRTRTTRAYEYGTYGLIDPSINAWVLTDPAGRGYGYSLTEVLDWLRQEG